MTRLKEKEQCYLPVVLDPGAKEPTRAHEFDAGLDLYSTRALIIRAHSRETIDTGVHVAIPKGFVGFLTSRSGMMRKQGLTCRGTIDCGYTGSIGAVIFNHSDEDAFIPAGSKITQLVIVPCIVPPVKVVDALEETERGDDGFGSTGR